MGESGVAVVAGRVVRVWQCVARMGAALLSQRNGASEVRSGSNGVPDGHGPPGAGGPTIGTMGELEYVFPA